MSKIDKIIAAIGFSDYAPGIYNFAAELADQMDAELIVASIINERDVAAVTTIVSLGYEVDGEHYVKGICEERKKLLKDIIEKSGFPDIQNKIIFKVGNPAEKLLQIIVEQEADMIIMGPKGRTNLERAFVGSVAGKIFRRSPVTVVSFREGEHSRRLRKKIHL